MLRISQNLSLQQKMAPQLIQSLQLLQMSTLELELEIKQQMELNPLLEEGLEQREEGDEGPEEAEGEEAPSVVEALKEEAEVPQNMEEQVNWDALLEDQFDRNSYNNESTEYDPNWEVDREPQENRITTLPPLVEQLQEQLILTDLGQEERQIAEFILGNIDERGYLTCPTAEIATALEVEVERVEAVLMVIQGFEPPGIGARDLAECLLIQLRQRVEPERELAMRMVGEFMEDLTKRRLTRITRALGIGNEQLKGAMDLIEKLQPYPGTASISNYNGLLTLDTEVAYITPDLIVEKVGEDWVVSLTEGNLPSLRINPSYAKLMKVGRRNGQDEVHTYLSKKLNDARWLINAIHQRRTTMLKVANYLVRAQMDFFEKGPGFLRPMVLQDVADAVGMHVSTISRVSNGKYMQTPHGVKELKYFFDSRVGREDGGEDVSARSVKEKISTLIEAEDPAEPLSDQEIADRLSKEEGLRIARRTVAKYRDQLGINAQRYRKKVF
ncbi:MAG: RNA polymerase factor sigma-54 [Candidatus Handelsmanbacteria bacterium]|nr:RNA polymerase factor sigma-54 [Candidatus Handelsmanbacteria bacterium]